MNDRFLRRLLIAMTSIVGLMALHTVAMDWVRLLVLGCNE